MNSFLDRSSRPRPLILAAAAATVVVVLGVLVLAVVGTRGRADKPEATLATPSGQSATPTPSTAPTGSSVRQPLQLPAATQTVSGVAIGYPQSAAGAVAAAIEFSSVSASLDPDRAAAVGRLIADPTWTTAPEDFAAGAISSRKQLGISVSGDLPTDASIAVEAAQYQLRDSASNRVTVLLLSYLSTSSPAQGSQTKVIVLPCPVHWTGADWRLDQVGSADYSDLVATPGTSEAAAAGWLDFRR